MTDHGNKKGHNDPQPQHGNDEKGHKQNRGGEFPPASSHARIVIIKKPCKRY